MIEAVRIAFIWLLGGVLISVVFGVFCILIGRFYEYVKNRLHREQKLSVNPEPEEPIIERVNTFPYEVSDEPVEQYQKQLDDWFDNILNETSKKGNKNRGLLYERYVGYRWEMENYKVEYVGIYKSKRAKGDEGIDLLCHDGDYTWVVQCKNYQRPVQPSNIRAHCGVVTLYAQAHPKEIVGGAFFATSGFSERSIQEAEKLNIQLFGNEGLPSRFPVIKCQVLSDKRLYFFPTDNEYDDIELNFETGDCYCLTVSEAVEKGFKYGGTSQIVINFSDVDKYENILTPQKNSQGASKYSGIVNNCHEVINRHTLEFEQKEKLERIKNVK